MELMDAASLRAVHALLGMDPPLPGAAQLTIQTDGAPASAEALAIADILRVHGGTAEVSADREAGERLLAVRRAMHPAMESLGTALIEDVSVPRSALPAMFDEIARVEREHGIVIPTVAHAGDGNLHPNLIFDAVPGPDGVVEAPAHIWAAADDLFQAALRLGGTLTGEHGIGVLKRRWLADELGDDQWELQRQIARVFDPRGILNPGKVFAP
jgi:glycolate oxidase